MPNVCENVVIVCGPAKDVRAFVKTAARRGSTFSLSKLDPLRRGTAGPQAQLEQWGAAWVDAVDRHLFSVGGVAVAAFSVHSAWSPPTSALRRISARWPTLTFFLCATEGGNEYARVFGFADGEEPWTWAPERFQRLQLALRDADGSLYAHDGAPLTMSATAIRDRLSTLLTSDPQLVVVDATSGRMVDPADCALGAVEGVSACAMTIGLSPVARVLHGAFWGPEEIDWDLSAEMDWLPGAAIAALAEPNADPGRIVGMFISEVTRQPADSAVLDDLFAESATHTAAIELLAGYCRGSQQMTFAEVITVLRTTPR
ncbi:hypothetical protein [Cellulomonas sp. URHE0023]|uniref:hypothetical protein n=1 Tax=Cellulomonas sp. URHE0023 TaxID=1380354 RepID=UPI00047FB2D2|nr:hypothetical protein [Cellulomonas sp. URHE0023]